MAKFHTFYGWVVFCCVCVCVAWSCPTLCDPMDCSPPASSVHGILLVRILEWVAIPFSRGSSQPRDRAQVSCIMGRCFTVWDTREAQRVCAYIYIYGLHVYSVISRHFCCFHFLAIVTNASVNVGVHISFQIMFSFSSDK